jgi:hypothetical protein
MSVGSAGRQFDSSHIWSLFDAPAASRHPFREGNRAPPLTVVKKQMAPAFDRGHCPPDDVRGVGARPASTTKIKMFAMFYKAARAPASLCRIPTSAGRPSADTVENRKRPRDFARLVRSAAGWERPALRAASQLLPNGPSRRRLDPCLESTSSPRGLARRVTSSCIKMIRLRAFCRRIAAALSPSGLPRGSAGTRDGCPAAR